MDRRNIYVTLAVILASAACSEAKLSHSAAMRRLSAAGITVSSSDGCSDRYTSTCTSLKQVNENTISGLETLKSASGCSINVTGGTEVGHASGTYSHWNGYKVDISLNSCINNYVTRRFTYLGSDQYMSAAGNIYTLEGNHWDIVFY